MPVAVAESSLQRALRDRTSERETAGAKIQSLMTEHADACESLRQRLEQAESTNACEVRC